MSLSQADRTWLKAQPSYADLLLINVSKRVCVCSSTTTSHQFWGVGRVRLVGLKGKPRRPHYPATIYHPRGVATAIGAFLSTLSLFLRCPAVLCTVEWSCGTLCWKQCVPLTRPWACQTDTGGPHVGTRQALVQRPTKDAIDERQDTSAVLTLVRQSSPQRLHYLPPCLGLLIIGLMG